MELRACPESLATVDWNTKAPLLAANWLKKTYHPLIVPVPYGESSVTNWLLSRLSAEDHKTTGEHYCFDSYFDHFVTPDWRARSTPYRPVTGIILSGSDIGWCIHKHDDERTIVRMSGDGLPSGRALYSMDSCTWLSRYVMDRHTNLLHRPPSGRRPAVVVVSSAALL